MKHRKGFLRLARPGLPRTALVISIAAVVIAAAVAAAWLASGPEAALGLAGGGLLLAVAAVGVFARLRRRRKGRRQEVPQPARVLASKALPRDDGLVPIIIGQGLLDAPSRLKSASKLSQKAPRPRAEEAQIDPGVVGRPAGGVEELKGVEPVLVEIGLALVPLASASRNGEWLGRIAVLRREIADELGMLIPPVRIRDNVKLSAHEYAIRIHGVKVGSGRLYPSRLLSLSRDSAVGKLRGQEVIEPAYGMPAVWIHPAQRPLAERMNHTIVDPCGALMMHLAVLVRRHAADLLSREQVEKLLENLSGEHPRLVAHITDRLKVSQIQRALQGLLREGVSISDLKGVVEALGDASEKVSHPDELVELTREHMGPGIARRHAAEDGRLWCVCLEPELEHAIEKHLTRTAGGSAIVIPRVLHAEIARAVSEGVIVLRERGHKPVVLCAGRVRAAVKQLIAPLEPDAAVLAHNEVKAITVQSLANVGLDASRPRTYTAATVAEAMAQVKRDLGRDAIVQGTRRTRGGRLRRLLGGRTTWEVTAVANTEPPRGAPGGRYVPASAAQGPDAPPQPPVDGREAKPASAAPGDPVARQMTEIHRMVETLVSRKGGPAEKFAPELREPYELLIQQDVDEAWVRQIIEQVQAALTPKQLTSRELVAKQLQEQIARRISVCPPVRGGGRRVIALIGPTGVGKTTTIAKLAANFRLNESRRVGLVTIDTYRIAAVDQLQTYANIIEVPLRVVLHPRDCRKAIDSLAADVVLIDTAGRSQNDKPRLEELGEFLAQTSADETHLVISAAANRANVQRTIESFAPLGANRIILTKLDEAETFGTILNIAAAVEAPISYVTTGQDVPEDISPADAHELAGRIAGGLLCAI